MTPIASPSVAAAGPDTSSDEMLVRPYVPRLLIERVAQRPELLVEEVEGSVVFVDVSGFTKLSERLAKLGKVGAEELTESIDSCFTGLLAQAYANAGSLIKFGGDALLLFFTGQDHLARACRSAIWKRRTLREIGKLETSGGRVNLRMSVGVHSGSFHFFLVGGSHREFMITGPAATEVVRMEGAADAGEIVVSPATAAGLPERLLGAQKGPGRLLKRVPDGRIVEPDEAPAVVSDVSALLGCVPVAIREHLLAGVYDPEHRLATVAFLHFEETDELIRTRGAEAAAAGLDELVRDVQAAADAHDLCFLGTDVDEDGGKIILTAGVPVGGGNDEEQMLLAVREIVARERTVPVRIGVHTGGVFAGDIGPPYRRTYTVMGDAVNLAARLMARAEPGHVLATADVLDRSNTRFATDELEPFHVKGKAKAVQAFDVGPASGTRAGEVVEQGPIVGRDLELATLREALEFARAGSGRFVEVVGESGVGKSRLVRALIEDAAGFEIRSTRAELYRSAIPYATFGPMYAGMLGLEEGSGDQATIARFTQVVDERVPHLRPWLPLLAVPLDVEVPATAESAELDERFRRDRLEAAVIELLGALVPGPALLVVEDAHWTDDASAELLRRLAGELRERPWVLCSTRRPGDGGLVAPDGDAVTSLRPAALAIDDIAHLLEALSEDAPLPPQDVRTLAERSGGNPLLARELLRAARAAGGVDGLPASVEALVTSRIDRLPPADRALLRRASVLGTSFSPGLLAELVGESVMPQTDDAWRRLEEFVEVRDDGSIAFRRALVRDAAYEKLPYRTRRELHERAGETIERIATDPEDEAEMLSLHFLQAKRFGPAWRYSRVAGDRAHAKAAPSEAATFYRRAVDAARSLDDVDGAELSEVWEKLGDVLDRAGRFTQASTAFRSSYRLACGDPPREAQLLLKQAWIPERAGSYPQAIRLINRGIKVLEGRTDLPARRQRAQLSAWFAAVRQAQGRSAEAVSWCERAIAEAEGSGDRDALAHAYFILDWAHHELGRPEQAVCSPLALEIYEEIGDLAGQAAVLNNMGAFAYWEGRWDDALELYERSREARERIGDPVNAAYGRLNVGEILSDQGRYEEAERAFREALHVWRAAETPSGVAFATSFLGRLATRAGRFDEGMTLLREASHLFTEVGATSDALEVDALIAENLVLQCRSSEALEVATAALAIDERLGGQSSQTPLLHRVHGYALLQAGDPSAYPTLENSLRVARARESDFEIAQTLAAIAKASTDPKVREDAERESADLFRKLGVRKLPPIPTQKGRA